MIINYDTTDRDHTGDNKGEERKSAQGQIEMIYVEEDKWKRLEPEVKDGICKIQT